MHITADALAEEVDYSDVDMVVLPGGIPGTPNLAANKDRYRHLRFLCKERQKR